MTAIGRLVLMPARLLEEDEREEVGRFLAESVHGIDAASEEQAGDEPDWSYLWHALLGAAGHAHRILALLARRGAAYAEHVAAVQEAMMRFAAPGMSRDSSPSAPRLGRAQQVIACVGGVVLSSRLT